MNLIEITDFNGATQYVSAGAVEQITEAGASSQWHGIRSIVRLFNGKVIESQNTAYEVASMVKRAAQEPDTMSETRSNGIGHFVQPTAEGMVDAMAAIQANAEAGSGGASR